MLAGVCIHTALWMRRGCPCHFTPWDDAGHRLSRDRESPSKGPGKSAPARIAVHHETDGPDSRRRRAARRIGCVRTTRSSNPPFRPASSTGAAQDHCWRAGRPAYWSLLATGIVLMPSMRTRGGRTQELRRTGRFAAGANGALSQGRARPPSSGNGFEVTSAVTESVVPATAP
jgi:hypothetical protein